MNVDIVVGIAGLWKEINKFMKYALYIAGFTRVKRQHAGRYADLKNLVRRVTISFTVLSISKSRHKIFK